MCISNIPCYALRDMKLQFGLWFLKFLLQVGLRFGPIWYLMTQPPKMSLLADFLNFVNYFFWSFQTHFHTQKNLVQKSRTPIRALVMNCPVFFH